MKGNLCRRLCVVHGPALVMLAALFALDARPLHAQILQQQALDQLALLLAAKDQLTAAEQKLDTELLFAVLRSENHPMFASLPALRTGMNLPLDDAGWVSLEVHGEITQGLIDLTNAVGAVYGAWPDAGEMYCAMPVVALREVAARTEVTALRRWYAPVPRLPARTAQNVSEGDVAHGADLARAAFGVDGSGVKTCVLSDSFNNLGGAAALVASGDLPGPGNPNGFITPVDVVADDFPGTGSDEGRAMLEIIHDLAPGSALGFATAGGSEAEFAANIRLLRDAGCDVIVDDIFFLGEGVFQDDLVAEAVDEVTADGVLYFSSAGNSGNLNDGTAGVWEGDFDVAASSPSAIFLHDFGGGVTGNPVTEDTPFNFVLQWSDPLGGSGNDYDLVLTNPSGTAILAVSTFFQNGNDDPFESITSNGFDDADNLLAVVRGHSEAPRFLHLNTIRGRLGLATDGQTAGHAAAAGAFGVAAVFAGAGVERFDGSETVETFSSDGPRQVFFNADGAPLTPGALLAGGGVVRAKPDLAAADGVSTATAGFDPFFGTSAAAPHAAAIAALLLDLDPALDRDRFSTLIATTAFDIEAAGPDRDSGVGLLDALALLEAGADTSPAVPRRVPALSRWDVVVLAFLIVAMGLRPRRGNRNSHRAGGGYRRA